MLVKMTPTFRLYLKERFPKNDQLKIRAFIAHVTEHGLTGLPGRNKSSDSVPTDDPQFLRKVRQAQKYNLWHYHIGIPEYVGIDGDKTSEYVLHYMRDDANECITLVAMTPHPPFELPTEDDLI